MRDRSESERLYQSALEHIVGGVNSPSRSFKAVGGGAPVFMQKGLGAYFWDADGNRYIDYLCAYGPVILGHAHPAVATAMRQAAETGVLFGTPTEWEVEFARTLKAALPSMGRVRFVNSGTEAVMTTIRVARAYTGRNKIIKFAGCYHGHSDLVLVAAGSGPSTLGVPDSAGITQNLADEVVTVPFNDEAALRAALDRWGDDTAAVLIEPIVGNFGMVLPQPGYLEQVCRWTREAGALMIFDEVITAFRFHYGGAQTFTEAFPDVSAVEPDLTALGKIIGGGLPIGAYGGKRHIMEQVAPLGPAYQAGTMAGNPASILAGLACLDVLRDPAGYTRMDRLAGRLADGIRAAAERHGVVVQVNRIRGAFSVHFGDRPITDYEAAKAADGERFAVFFRELLDRGICLAPSKFEAWFLTLAHTDADIDVTLDAVEAAMAAVQQM